jgi:hypothetical protein
MRFPAARYSFRTRSHLTERWLVVNPTLSPRYERLRSTMQAPPMRERSRRNAKCLHVTDNPFVKCPTDSEPPRQSC